MSVRVMSAVFDRYPAGGGERLLALALADVARDDGILMINDSVPELARKTMQTDRGVRLQLRRMEAIGWLCVMRASDGGRGRTTVYRIAADWLAGKELQPAGGSGGLAEPPASAPETRNAATVNPEPRSGVPETETRNAATANPERGSGAYVPTGPNTLIPPNPPLQATGGKADPVNPKPQRKPSASQTLKAWLTQCAERGQAPIPEADAVFAYCDRVGIGRDILALHWAEFKDRRGNDSAKRQADWPRTFRNSVRDNWFRLWFIAPGQVAQLTTAGRQAAAAHAFNGQPA